LRRPTSLLNRVDFPTLGRPTMAIIGFMVSSVKTRLNITY
jgi:hypothetical protein